MKKKVLILIMALVVVIGISGVSYAYLKTEKISEKSNTITLSSLDVILLTDMESVTLDNKYPVLDEVGLTNTMVSFQIKNNAVVTAKYNLRLTDPDNQKSTMLNKDVRYQLKRTNETTGAVETLDIKNLDDTGLIDVGTIESGVVITYELIMWVDYNASPSGLTFTKVIQIDGVQKPNLDESGANYPELLDNMIPVYYEKTTDTTGVWKKADEKNLDTANQWFDYDNFMWANAVTVKANGTKTRGEYLTASVGTEINMDDILAMWVWIPRYKYVIFNGNNQTTTEQQINVVFEHGIDTTGTVSCTDTISVNSTSSQTCTDSINDSIVNNKSTYTHPAFTFGDEELTGFWASKFEMSTDDSNTNCTSTNVSETCDTSNLNILVKPNTLSLRYQNIANQFASIRKMEIAGNIYGFNQSTSAANYLDETGNLSGNILGDNNNLDTHMIKNMEWGAIAYLSQSQYGKYGNSLYTGENRRIYNNNYYSTDTYKTGYSSGDFNANYSTTSTYQYNDLTNSSDGKGYLGAGASTTGTVYGVYDMNGGSFELVMANQVNASNNFAPDMNNTWNNTNIPANKYYDKYSYNTSMTSFSRGKLGDATREILTTNGVFSSATALMPHASNSWFGRGGTAGYSYDGGPVSSIFAFEYYDSSSTVLTNSASTRPVLTVVRDLPWLND